MPNRSGKNKKGSKNACDAESSQRSGGRSDISGCSAVIPVQIGRRSRAARYEESISTSSACPLSTVQANLPNLSAGGMLPPFWNFYRVPVNLGNCGFANYAPLQCSYGEFFAYNAFFQNLQYQSANNVSFRREDNLSAGGSRRNSASRSDHSKSRNPKLIQRRWSAIPMNGALKSGTSFTLMNYNVLAQSLLDMHPELYQNHARQALGWEIRWKNLLAEIKTHNCDILCLQEVEESYLQNFYNPQLENLGYVGIFKKRTGIRPDGCAIFYKKDKFVLQEYTTVEYRQPNVSVLNRDNVAIIAKIAPVENLEADFVVATTHLLYNPRRADVRLAQTLLLLAEVDRIAYQPRNGSSYSPVIITGDFNSDPTSVVYQLLRNGRLDFENLELRSMEMPKGNSRTIGKQFLPRNLRITDTCQHDSILVNRQQNNSLSRLDELKTINIQNSENEHLGLEENKMGVKLKELFGTGRLSHNFSLRSVYDHVYSNDIEGTTFQDEWITVDYIFFSDIQQNNMDKLRLLSRYSLPLSRDLQSVTIPNHSLGSDHLCLIAKFHLEF